MQFSEAIVITDDFINALSYRGVNRSEILKSGLNQFQKSISLLLSSYHWAEKGSVETISIDPYSINIDDQGSGKFKVHYAINIHYGCSDVDIDLDKAMLITIATDIAHKKAVLTGEYIPEREPDEF